ncbi:MAG: hypothetical protein K2X60_00890 [Xanthobacteraceae bacterium]|nr:hypothetical protein [Xanthobacteraceae bacterium]
MTSVLSNPLLKAATITVFCAVIGAALGTSIPAAHADPGPFDGYAGSWSGTGSIQIADAGSERIRCKGTYTVDGSGNNLRQSLRCASDSYRFDLTTNITASGGQLSGNWTESSRGVNGIVAGAISGGNVVARVETNGYVATFNITTKSGKQSVAIASPGELRAVNMSLTRGN